MKPPNLSTLQRRALAREISWPSFCYKFLEDGFFEHEDRSKTAKALRVLWERMPKRSLRKLMRMPVIIFAPTPHVWAQVTPALAANDSETQLVYFSPQLEDRSQKWVNSTVAHEFAHVLFKHGLMDVDQDGKYKNDDGSFKKKGELTAERRADAEIKKWGYRAAYSCNR